MFRSSACLDMPRSSRACHSPQDAGDLFVVSRDEDWLTSRRIVGTYWAKHWEIQKVMLAETVDGDKRVAHVLWSVALLTIVALATGASVTRRLVHVTRALT